MGADVRASVMSIVRANVARYGWHRTGVFDAEPPFCYTTGLWQTAKCHPEILIVGLPPEQGAAVLLTVGQNVVDHDVRYTADRDYDGVIENYKAAFVTADREGRELCGTARGFYGAQWDAVDVLQLVWPDAAHRFPWSVGCAPSIRARQPIYGDWRGQ